MLSVAYVPGFGCWVINAPRTNLGCPLSSFGVLGSTGRQEKVPAGKSRVFLKGEQGLDLRLDRRGNGKGKLCSKVCDLNNRMTLLSLICPKLQEKVRVVVCLCKSGKL